MAQLIRTRTSFPEDHCSIPRSHMAAQIQLLEISVLLASVGTRQCIWYMDIHADKTLIDIKNQAYKIWVSNCPQYTQKWMFSQNVRVTEITSLGQDGIKMTLK